MSITIHNVNNQRKEKKAPLTSSCSFHISPRLNQNDADLSFHKSQKLILRDLRRSKSCDTCHNQHVFRLHMSDDGHTINNVRFTHLDRTSNDLVLNNDLPSFFMKNRNKVRSITIDLNTSQNNDKNVRAAKDLNQILKDVHIYSDQLYNTHGSIHIQAHSPQSKRCCCCSCCNHNQSIEIYKQISDFENEMCQDNFVEYIYKIECIANKNTNLE